MTTTPHRRCAFKTRSPAFPNPSTTDRTAARSPAAWASVWAWAWAWRDGIPNPPSTPPTATSPWRRRIPRPRRRKQANPAPSTHLPNPTTDRTCRRAAPTSADCWRRSNGSSSNNSGVAARASRRAALVLVLVLALVSEEGWAPVPVVPAPQASVGGGTSRPLAREQPRQPRQPRHRRRHHREYRPPTSSRPSKTTSSGDGGESSKNSKTNKGRVHSTAGVLRPAAPPAWTPSR
mmetsp:Transcript_31051/g.90841  ORF Transcript_31051/g.90841 Transcript_31051/m.90841 type:complete len:234 (-) Transcript_31051:980-1681(-)